MRKLKTVLFTAIVLAATCSYQSVSAGDAIFDFMNFENIKDSDGSYHQDAIVVLLIKEVNKSEIKAEVIKTVAGNFSQDFIILSEMPTYYNVYGIMPKEGDIAAVPIKITDRRNLIANAVSPSLLISDQGAGDASFKLYITDDSANIIEIKALELYINSNSSLRCFSFDDKNGILTVHDNDNDYTITAEEIKQTSPKYERSMQEHIEIEPAKISSYETMSFQDASIETAENTKNDLIHLNKQINVKPYIMILSLITALLVLLLVIRHNRGKHKSNYKT